MQLLIVYKDIDVNMKNIVSKHKRHNQKNKLEIVQFMSSYPYMDKSLNGGYKSGYTALMQAWE